MRRRPDPSDEQSFDDTPAAVGVDGLAVDPKALRRLAELEGRGAMSDIHQVAPTPWRTWLGYRESDRGHRYYILDAQGDVIAGIMDSEDPEMTGQRLVRAANSHDALVAALRSAIDCVDEQATVIQELRSGGLATVAIPGWYLDAKKLLEEAAALRAAEPD